ncbi:hypothetical protein LCGC14_0463790 [marine sediment metagenome]|uniref:Methyltransferase FkbM domain-containing protein n=1 Tax=marine sediment metagenome TaxID=412755 RepID=A0A0F9V114_9ZZZZ
MFSQREEEKHILSYFGDSGVFLDIGSYHPEIFSNVRALYERGWKGVCIEPSKNCYPTLAEFYKDTEVEVYNCAIGNKTGIFNLFDSNGDALSSTDPAHVKKWIENYNSVFTKVPTQFYTLNDLLKKSKYKQFNFVSIDVENDRLGIDILKQIDLYSVGMICLECSYQYRKEVNSYMAGWKEIYSNGENIILCR